MGRVVDITPHNVESHRLMGAALSMTVAGVAMGQWFGLLV